MNHSNELELLTRHEFKTLVFSRSADCCVQCGQPAVDAHHLLDRSLWDDGGYYVENGVALCAACHLLAESGDLDPQTLRLAAGIHQVVLPPTLSSALEYDKWGRPLKMVIKYPRTMHLPWSPGLQNDDRVIESLDSFRGEQVVVSEKMDGENTNLYRDHIHARSPSFIAPHPSRNWVKQLWERVRRDIPEGWRVCGENMYAKHSIHYQNLPDFFLVFSIWEGTRCLSWDETLEWCELLGLTCVPHGPVHYWDDLVHEDWEDLTNQTELFGQEGYVVRVARSFQLEEFPRVVAKYVRKNHVQTTQHWLFQPIVRNVLQGERQW